MTPASSMPPLDGATTGAAKEIDAQLARIRLPVSGYRFLSHLKVQTFGNAGFHRQWKHERPGTWTHFDLATWSEATDIPRSTLCRIRDRLVEDALLWYEADPDIPGRGRIGWNLNLQTWQPRQPSENWGGKRQKQASLPILTPGASGLINLETRLNRARLENSVADDPARLESLPDAKTSRLESAPASVPDVQTPRQRSRIRRKEEDTKEETTSLAADAAQGNLFQVIPIGKKQDKSLPADGSKKERAPYAHQDMLDVMKDALGHGPDGGEWEKWSTGFKRLKAYKVDTQELQDLIIAYRRRWPKADCNPQALYGHLGQLRYDVKHNSGSHPAVKMGGSNYGPGNDKYAHLYD